ncbi:MAG: HAMP domain-containing sensor histidine kinase [Sphingomonas sp.]
MTRLLGSFSFRLVLIQVTVFSLSVALLLGLFYWLAHVRPTVDVQESLVAEYAQLERVHRDGGIAALKTTLERRAAARERRQGYHVLIDARGRLLSYNLPYESWPRSYRDQWLRLDADVYRDGVEDDHEALSLDSLLPDGTRLLVGRDVEDLDRVERAIRRALVYGLPALLLLITGAGALSSRAIGKRIETMSGTARRVMEGDLSERVPLRGRDDDFDQLAATLNAMLDRIEASLEAVRRVSDSVAHELRTPLARLQADLAELAAAPPERAAALAERAQGEAQWLARMFDGVLRISGIEAERHRVSLRPLDLSGLVADAAEYHAPQAEERCLTLDTAIEPGIEVTGDPDLLFQALSNLIDNAAKFTPRGGRIAVSLAREGGAAVLAVADTGPGVPPELTARLGERFFRAPGTADVPGFGLGLALASSVAALHGSELRFADAGPGLRVELRLGARG